MTPVTALLRRPSPLLAQGIVTHIERSSIDLDLARQQWDDYVGALRAERWTTVEVPPLDSCPDSVFVEDTMVVFKNLAVIAHPGADSRKPETTAAEKTVAGLGYTIEHISGTATLDGGDVLKVGSTIYVGFGGRTNEEGVSQLRSFLEPLGGRVLAVPTAKVLHLKSAVTALPDGTVIGFEPLVDNPHAFERFLGVPEESGAHVVLLGENRLLIAADCPKTHDLFRSMGYELVVVDISEYEKLEGCVTCLSVRLREVPSSRHAVSL